jgi:hypothetical protein
MSTRKKIGMILVLAGSFWFLISFVLTPYSPGLGFIWHLNYMTTTEIVLKEGKWLQFPDGYVPPPALPSALINQMSNFQKQEPVMPMDQYLQLRDEYDKKYKEYQEKYAELLKKFTPHYEGRIAIPYKYLFILNIAIIFTGFGMLILSKQTTQG